MKKLMPIVLAVILVSCSSNSSKKTQKISTQKTQGQSNADHAQVQADIASLLLRDSQSIEKADSILNDALKSDPQNSLALFLKTFTDISMNFKGAYNHLDSSKNNTEIKETIYGSGSGELVDFLINQNLPKRMKKISSVANGTEFVRYNLIPSIERGLKKLEKISDSFSINFTSSKVESVENCYDVVIDEFSYTECDMTSNFEYGDSTQVKLDKHDVKVIKSALELLVLNLKVMTAYNLDDVYNIEKEMMGIEAKQYEVLTDRQVVDVLSRYPNFMTLRRNHRLAEVSEHLKNVLNTSLDMMALRGVLCKDSGRSGFLFNSICIDEISQSDIAESLSLLTGPKNIVLGVDSQGKKVKVLVDMQKLFSNPIKDLKAYLPKKFDRNGTVESYAISSSLNGVFPENNISKKLKTVQESRKIIQKK